MHGPAPPREQVANRRHVCTPNIPTLPQPRKKRALAAPGACYDASQPRSCGAGSGERDGNGRTRIPFRHAPVPGWACYGPASSRRTRSAFEARQPLPRFLAIVRLKLRLEVRGHDHQVHEALGIAPGSVVVLVGAREPLGIAAEVAGGAVDEGDQFANGEWRLHCLRLEAEPCGVLVHDPVTRHDCPSGGPQLPRSREIGTRSSCGSVVTCSMMPETGCTR